jgi:integrase
VLARLPAYARGPLTFASITGWRKSEVLGLEWSRVDFKASVVRLDPHTAKTEHGRTFPLTPQFRALLEAQRETTNTVQKKKNLIIPWVFHRNGRRLKGFAKSWRQACREAGLPGRIFHDPRRTAVRTLQRAGVPTATAMELVGHRTMSIYKRYSITDEAMLREGAAKLAAYGEGKVLGKVKAATEAAAF